MLTLSAGWLRWGFLKGLFADNSFNQCCQKIEGEFLSCKPTTMKAWKLRNAEENSQARRHSQQVTLFTRHRFAAVSVRLKTKMSRGMFITFLVRERLPITFLPNIYLVQSDRRSQRPSLQINNNHCAISREPPWHVPPSTKNIFHTKRTVPDDIKAGKQTHTPPTRLLLKTQISHTLMTHYSGQLCAEQGGKD